MMWMFEFGIVFLIDFGIAISVALGIGAGNESMAPLAGSGITTVKTATLLGALLAFLGAVILGYRVEGTIGKGLLTNEIAAVDVLVMMFSMATWSILASYRGWPVSITHSSIGAAIGLGLTKWGVNSVNWILLTSMTVTWVLSPLIALFGAIIVLKVTRYYLRRYMVGLARQMRVARLLSVPLLIWSGIFAFSVGANDIGKATAFLSVVYGNSLLVRVVVGVGLLLGSIILGKRVTRSIGLKLAKLDPITALSAETTTALIMLFGTVLGLPLSGTHILVGAVIGVASAKGVWMDIRGLKQIVFTWLATYFVAMLLCSTVFIAITNFF